jgi:hypothetical protein
VLLGASAITLLAQETQTTSLPSKPAATRSQADCTGFIANPPISRDLSVIGGQDDDTHSAVRQFIPGKSVFISNHSKEDIAVGAEYSVVRPAKEIFTTQRYSGQGRALGRLGTPYQDLGRVKVTHVNSAGIVAEVTFACLPIFPGDILMPFQPRPIPEYTVNKPLDRFAPLDADKPQGRVAAARNNFGFVGKYNILYVDLGENAGITAGQRFRIFKVPSSHPTGFLQSERTPAEILGEAVVLSVQAKSCVAIVVDSYREIAAGDGVQLE